MLTGDKIMSNGNNQSCMMVKRGLGMELRKRVRKVMVDNSNFAKIFFKNEDLPASTPHNYSHKKIGKRKNKGTSGIIQKKARKEDWSSKMAETEKEKDGDELLNDFIEHDKKYFFVHSAKISCKLCSFKGKPIVQHYRTSHPESEVLISRINPDITKILIEDSIRNREEYGKDHPELENNMCNFKCPFCLMLIKDTAHGYYNHISSHTGEYCFHCNHCSYWTYNHANVHSHLNQMHYKIQKTEYKMIYLNPKVSKYVFGYICSECNFIQLVRTTVEEHAMVYHPGTPEIHRVNLGVLLHDDVDDNEEGVTLNKVSTNATTLNLSELVPPYNCIDDGFQSCPFKTLYFDEYLKHVETIHQVDGFGSFSSELQREAVMEGWLAKDVGPFQCGYCRKATVTHQEMERHQAVFHVQKQCLFYYRKFVLKDTVIIPEQVNLEDPSFINHVIHLPDQIHLCDFKLMDGLTSLTSTKLTNLEAEVSFPLLPLPIKDIKVDLDQLSVFPDKPEAFSVVANESDTPCLDIQTDLNQSTASIDDPEVFSMVENGETYLVDESDSLCLDEQPKDDGTHIDAMVAVCKLQCEWKGCHQTCHSQMTLAKHINKSHVRSQKGKKLTCLWINCPRKSKPYSTKQDLLEHMRFHSAEKPYECAFQGCNKAFSQLSDLKLHQNTHTGERPYFCQFPNCFKSFLTSDVRNNHQKIHYNTKRYACPVTSCSKEYAHQRCIWKHMKKHTVDEQLEAKQKSVEEKQKSSSSLDKAKHQKTHYDTLQCEWKNCHQTYDSQGALVNHIKKNHVQLQGGEKFTCSWINCPLKSKPFSTKSRLSMHMRVHTGEKPHKCSFHGCNRAFAQLGTLQVHERRHTGKRPYLCQFPNCLKRFATNYIRSRHQRTHCNTVLYGYFMSTSNQVTSCSEKYTDPDSLEKPVKNHMANKQFKAKLVKDKQKGSDFGLEKSSNCSDGAKHQRTDYDNLQCKWKDCYQTCHSKSALVRHLENDHVLLQKGRIFTCFWINCPRKLKPYTTKQNLVVHMRTHSKKPYKCAFQGCSMKSASLSSLKIHQRNHTKKKTYLCEYPNCFKSFSQSSHMIDHQMTHYDTEAYACKVISCSKKYADPISQLNRVKQKSVKNEQKENDFIIYDL